jgi:ribosome-associated protein
MPNPSRGPRSGPNDGHAGSDADSRPDPRDIADIAAEALADRQGDDIVLLDLTGSANFTDYFVIASGGNERHSRALVEAVDQSLSGRGVEPLHVEGTPESGWVLMDYGSVLVHVFDPARRAYYRLEALWAKSAPVIHFR